MELTCRKCKYRWVKRVDDLPKECPECKSRRWNEDPQPKYRRNRPVKITEDLVAIPR